MMVVMLMLSIFNYKNSDYQAYYDNYRHAVEEHEVIWNLLSVWARQVDMSFFMFRAIILSFGFFLIFYTIVKRSKRPDIFSYLYLIFPFALDVVQIRNFIVMALLIYAFPYLIEGSVKGRLKFAIAVLVGAGFHYVAFIYLPLAVIDLVFGIKRSLKMQISIFIVIVGALLYLVNNYALEFQALIFENYSEMDTRIEGVTNQEVGEYGYLMYWLFHISAAFFTYFAIRYSKDEKSLIFFRKLFTCQIYLALFFQYLTLKNQNIDTEVYNLSVDDNTAFVLILSNEFAI